MNTTENYGLKKPEPTDFYNVEDFNSNMDLIDAKLKEVEETGSNNSTSINNNSTSIEQHISNKKNPHAVTKAQIGLGNVDNTSDSVKSVKYAQSAGSAPASDVYDWAKAEKKPTYTKQEVGLSNVPNVSTNNQTPTYTVPSDNAELVSGEKLSVAFGKIAKAVKSLISHIANKSNPHSVTKAQLGLGNVDNTSDVNKPISTATQQAINYISSKLDYKGAYAGNIDDLVGKENCGGYWVSSANASGSQPFDSGFYLLEVPIEGGGSLQRAIYYNSGEVKSRFYTNSKWYDWTPDKQDTITGGASTITSSNLSTNKVLISNGNGKVATSAITTTELSYLDGISANVQTQLDSKQDSLYGGTYTGDMNNLVTVGRFWCNGNANLPDGITWGVCDVLQTSSNSNAYVQIIYHSRGIYTRVYVNSQWGGWVSKQNIITGGASTITSSDLTASRALVSDSNGKVAASAVTSKELGYLDGASSNIQTQLNNITDNIGDIIYAETKSITTTNNYYVLADKTNYYLANAYVVRDDSLYYVRGINRRSAGGYTLVFEDITSNASLNLYLVWVRKTSAL